jgi:8-oxo-dGTP pyrophosphatase MutT (NUDIX family)
VIGSKKEVQRNTAPMLTPTQIQAHIARRAESDSPKDKAKTDEPPSWEFLVLQRAADEDIYPNLWQVVTGMIESKPLETAPEAAFREIQEETGLQPHELWVLPTVASFFSLRDNAIVHVPCFGVIVPHGAQVALSGEHQAFAWLGYEQALERLPMPSHIEGTKVFYEHILTKLNSAPFRRIAAASKL